MQLNHFNKLFCLLSLTTLSLFNSPYVEAQAATSSSAGTSGGGDYLKRIADNTEGLLKGFDVMLSNSDFGLGVFIKSWISTKDPSDDTAPSLQTNFAQLGKLLLEQTSNQDTQQVLINSDLLNNSILSALNMSINLPNPQLITPTNTSALPYANDLVYSTLLDKPFYKKDPRAQGKSNMLDPAYNYIKNASAVNVYHIIPGQNWHGSDEAQSRYQNFYNTVMAIESFNAYVLSGQYVDKGQLNQLQTQLINQATDSTTWFAKVGSENLGYVLRQILMYESQIFVVMTEVLKTQKQAIIAQTMTNSLLIVNNQINENMLVANAKNQQPTL